MRIILTALVFSLSSLSAEASDVIDRVTNASVLIRTQLLHGFTEDEVASGRFSGSGFIIIRNVAGSYLTRMS
jgi:hypothetical protein